jgi:hypothetical protein
VSTALKIKPERPPCFFKPRQRSDGRWAIELHPGVPGKLYGFLMWIESTDGKMCRSNHPDFAVQSFYALEEAEGLCAWLKQEYDAERIS